jgi:hypothetical protein
VILYFFLRGMAIAPKGSLCMRILHAKLKSFSFALESFDVSICIQIGQVPEALFETQEKSDYPVSGTGPSDFVGTNGNQGCHRTSMRSSSSGQATSGWWRGRNYDNSMS